MYRTTQSPLVTQLATRMIITTLVIIHSQLIKWSILISQINFVKDWTVIVSVTGVLIPVDFSGVKKMTCQEMSRLVQTCHTQGDEFFYDLIVTKYCDKIVTFFMSPCDLKPPSPSSPFNQRRAFKFFFVPNQCKYECRSKTDGDLFSSTLSYSIK